MANNQLNDITGMTLYDSGGEKIGTVKELYLDESSEEPKWATVSSGIFGTKQHFLPLEGASRHEDGLMVPHAKQTILSAPQVSAGDDLDEGDEGRLYSHYSMDSSTTQAGAGTDDQSQSRSEDSQRSGQEQHQTGKVRLRKYIVTETQQIEVPTKREVFKVENESEDVPQERSKPAPDSVQKPVFGEVRKPARDDELTDQQ